jgi:hypothetical protein
VTAFLAETLRIRAAQQRREPLAKFGVPRRQGDLIVGT